MLYNHTVNSSPIPSRVSWLSHSSTPHDILSKHLAAFPHRLLAPWWKTNDSRQIDFCETLEIKLAELGFEWNESSGRYRLKYHGYVNRVL